MKKPKPTPPPQDKPIQAIQAIIRQKQEEHEDRKRRISTAIANGARISRNTLSHEALFRALIPGWKPEAEK